jgi:[acyl-carrier-protein] S-malonyltransferase
VTESKLVFLLPGQGAQKVGMGRNLAEAYPDVAGSVFKRADEILGFPLSELCFEGPQEELVQTENTQPALFVTSVATISVLTDLGVHPAAAAGHSVGEFAALVAAGSLDFEEALPVVRKRGELMASASQKAPGTMAALVGLDADQVRAICAVAGSAGVVEPSNMNAPNQIVISGEHEAVDIAVKAAQDSGARAVRLNVSAPFHCSLMEPVRDEFETALLQLSIRDPSILVVSNATGDYARTADDVRTNLLDQLSAPVRWTQSMLKLRSDGYERFVEVGPGRVLSGLMRSIDRTATTASAGSAADIAGLVGRIEQG